MNSVDIIILAILALSALRGFLRGFLYEIQSTIGLFLGLIIAQRYSYILAPHLSSLPSLLIPTASFIATAVLATFAIGYAISFVSPIFESILTPVLNKFFGVLAGIFKGFVACIILISIANYIMPTNPTLQASELYGVLVSTAEWLVERALHSLPDIKI